MAASCACPSSTNGDPCTVWPQAGRSTFANASTITDVTYGPKVTMIHPGEFYRNKVIQRVTFLMDEIEIPDEAFHEAEGLTTVVLPERVTAIGEQAFRTVPSLTSLTLPPTINKIGKDAFNGCKAIKQITIPATATSIGYAAFQHSSLEKCTIIDSEQSLTINRNIFDGMDVGQLELYIGRPLIVDDQSKSDWDGARALREITYGGSYSGMVAKEAYNCNGLQKVVVSSPLVTEIPEQAFMNCENLSSVTLHDGIKVIGKEAFRNDKMLTAIHLPEQLTTIHTNAFYNCPLKSITLPASVTLLGTNSFGTDGPLSSIVCLGSTPPVFEGFPFYYTDKARNGEMKLYVPKGAVDAYQNAEHWKEFYFISTDIPTSINPSPKTHQPSPKIWYTIDGRRLNEAPTHPGCYIYNGKKIMK